MSDFCDTLFSLNSIMSSNEGCHCYFHENASSEPTIYLATFTTLTPAMRESDRKAFISASSVGNGLFLLITSTTAVRFTKLENSLRQVAESFTAIPAPTSGLRNNKHESYD